MKHRFLYIMALLLTVATSAWAQDPAPIDLTPNADGTVWTLDAMPAYDIELQVEYYTELKEDFATAYDPLTNMDIDVWVERTLQPGSYNTFALPFGMTLADFKTKIGDSDVKVKELTDATLNGKTLTLTFGDATEIAACTPYLVKLSGSESVTLGAFDEVYMTSPVEPQTISKGGLIDFVATLGLTTPSADKENILFVGANNALLHPSDNGQKIKGFRAYFELKGEAQNAQSFGIDLNEGGETGISSIENGELKIENESWHTIDGKRINGKPTQKGVYIMNGKKTVL